MLLPAGVLTELCIELLPCFLLFISSGLSASASVPSSPFSTHYSGIFVKCGSCQTPESSLYSLNKTPSPHCGLLSTSPLGTRACLTGSLSLSHWLCTCCFFPLEHSLTSSHQRRSLLHTMPSLATLSKAGTPPICLLSDVLLHNTLNRWILGLVFCLACWSLNSTCTGTRSVLLTPVPSTEPRAWHPVRQGTNAS